MKRQKLGPVSFKSLMEIGQMLVNIFIANSAMCSHENYMRRKKAKVKGENNKRRKMRTIELGTTTIS